MNTDRRRATCSAALFAALIVSGCSAQGLSSTSENTGEPTAGSGGAGGEVTTSAGGSGGAGGEVTTSAGGSGGAGGEVTTSAGGSGGAGGADGFVPFLQAYSSPGADYVKAMATDTAGHILVATLFSGTIAVGQGGETLVSKGGIDAGVIEYDPETGGVVRAFAFGGAGTTVPHGIAVDSTNHRVVVGYNRSGAGPGVASYDPGGSPSGDIPFSGGEKPFIAKLAPDGTLAWARMIDAADGTGPDTFSRAWDVAVDEQDNIHVVGHFRNTVDLDPGPGEFTITSVGGSTDLFVVTLTSGGDFVHGFALGGPGADAGPEGAAVSPGGTGDCAIAAHGGKLFVQGTFEQTASLAGTLAPSPESELTSAGAGDIFLSRYDAATGAFEKALHVGNAADEGAAPGTLRADPSGNLFFAARSTGAADWSGGAGTGLVDGGGSAVVVASFDADLGFRWAARLASTGGNDGCHRVLPDGAGDVLIAGWHNGTTDFDPGPGTASLVSAAAEGTAGLDIYVARLHDGGDAATLVWADAVNATALHETTAIPAGLAIDGSGHVWIGGQFFVPTDFAPGPAAVVLTPAGASDGFVARYRGDTGAADAQ